jgi:hypothetical protein
LVRRFGKMAVINQRITQIAHIFPQKTDSLDQGSTSHITIVEIVIAAKHIAMTQP